MGDYHHLTDDALASMEHHLAAFVDLADTYLAADRDMAVWLETLDNELYRIRFERETRTGGRTGDERLQGETTRLCQKRAQDNRCS